MVIRQSTNIKKVIRMEILMRGLLSSLVITGFMLASPCQSDEGSKAQLWFKMRHYDKNRDHKLSKEEYKAINISQDSYSPDFDALDINEDGYLNKAEYMYLEIQDYEKVFLKFIGYLMYVDSDRDGIIKLRDLGITANSPREVLEIVEGLKEYDTNGDGIVEAGDVRKKLNKVKIEHQNEIAALLLEEEDPILTDQSYGKVTFGDKLSAIEEAIGEKAITVTAGKQCKVATFKRYPGIRFMVEDGIVTRADIVEFLIENMHGIRSGTPVAEVKRRYPDVLIKPHKFYVGGSYLIFKSKDGNRAIVFEVPSDSVYSTRAGLEPSVEECPSILESSQALPLEVSPAPQLGEKKPLRTIWSRTYASNVPLWAERILQTRAGDFIVLGRIETSSGSERTDNGFVIKLDPRGKILWQKKYGGPKRENLYGVKEAADGSYVIAGASTSFGSSRAAWVLKLSPEGTILWQKAYRAKGNISVSGLDLTSEDDIVVAGSINSSGKEGRKSDDAWIFKIDRNGSLLWSKTYGGAKTDCFLSIRSTSDRGLVAAGLSQSFGGPPEDIWVVKLTEDGSVTWQKIFNRKGNEQVSSIQQTSDGGYVIAGWFWNNDLAVKTNPIVWKLQSDGSVAWQKRYMSSGGADARSLVPTSDGGYLFVGSASGVGPTYSDVDLFIAKLDEKGGITWGRRYGGPRYDAGLDVIKTSGNAYVVLGSTYSLDAPKVGAWVVKINSDGKIRFDRTSGRTTAPHLISLRTEPVAPKDTQAITSRVDIVVADTKTTGMQTSFQNRPHALHNDQSE